MFLLSTTKVLCPSTSMPTNPRLYAYMRSVRILKLYIVYFSVYSYVRECIRTLVLSFHPPKSIILKSSNITKVRNIAVTRHIGMMSNANEPLDSDDRQKIGTIVRLYPLSAYVNPTKSALNEMAVTTAVMWMYL